MARAKLGELFVSFAARMRGFDEPLEKSRKKSSDFFRNIKAQSAATSTALGTLRRATDLVLAGWATNTARQLGAAAIESVTSLGDQAEALGISTQKLQGYRAAAASVSIEQSTLVAGIAKMATTIAAAKQGQDSAIELLTRLGLSARDFDGLGVAEQFERVSTALTMIPDAGARLQASSIFGASRQQFITMAKSLGSATRDFDRMGIAIRDIDVARIRELDDALDKLKVTAAASRDSLVAAMAPVLTEAVQGAGVLAENLAGATRRGEQRPTVLSRTRRAVIETYGELGAVLIDPSGMGARSRFEQFQKGREHAARGVHQPTRWEQQTLRALQDAGENQRRILDALRAERTSTVGGGI